MALLYEQLSAVPGENGNRPPPAGAPEGGLSIGQINEVLRWCMAAIKEVGDLAAGAGGDIGSLGRQEADTVDIQGGSIRGTTLDNTNSMDAVALKSGLIDRNRLPSDIRNPPTSGTTPQAAYDLAWPVGSQRMWGSTSFGAMIPGGVLATWIVVTAAQDALLVGAGSSYAAGAAVGTGTGVGISTDGAHSHSGTTDNTQLNHAQIPAHIVDISGAPIQPAGTLFFDANLSGGGGNDLTYTSAPATGHNHGFDTNPGGSHNHSATLPKRYATVLLQRTA